MERKSISPITTWIFWGILVLGIFILVTREYFVAGFSTDSSRITQLILGFFILGLLSSLWIAYYLQKEFKALERMSANQRIGDASASDAAALFDSAMERIRLGDRINIRNLISAYGARIKARVEHIGVIAGMLITIGLLGTVLGLIMTVTGLDTVLKANATDYAAMKAGLNETVSGMGTAFYTTFYGALLGGVVLKVLGAEMRKSATQLVASTVRFSELYLAPQAAQSASEALDALEQRVAGLGQNLEQLGTSFGSVVDTIDSRKETLSSGLDELVASVGQAVESTNDQANERIGTLVASVDGALRQSDERTTALVGMIEAANRQADDRIEALIAVSKTTIEETNRTAEERLTILVEGIDQIVGEAHRITGERAEALAKSIEETTSQTHRLADERLNALLGTVENAAQDTHRQANERLVELVDQVGISIDQTRRVAEERLSTKASALAQKLSEAAGVLAALSEASGENSEPMDTDRA